MMMMMIIMMMVMISIYIPNKLLRVSAERGCMSLAIIKIVDATSM